MNTNLGRGRVTRDFFGRATPLPDDDAPPGPWDPVIRASIRHAVLGDAPHTDPWKHVITGIAREVSTRAALAQQIIDISGETSRSASAGMSRWVDRFADDFCITGLELRWPFPTPQPKWWRGAIDSKDRILLGAALHDSATETSNPDLAAAIQSSAEKLVQAVARRC